MGSTFHLLRLRYGAAPPPPPPPLSLWPQHYGIPLSQPFSRVGTLLAHTAQTTSGTRESWKPIQKFLRQRDCSKLYKRA